MKGITGIIVTVILICSLFFFQEGTGFRVWLFLLQTLCGIEACRRLLKEAESGEEAEKNGVCPWKVFVSLQLLPICLFNSLFFILEPLKWMNYVWAVLMTGCCGICGRKNRLRRKEALSLAVFIVVLMLVAALRGMPVKYDL